MDFLFNEKIDHIPFSKVELESYLPELEKLISLSKERIEEIKSEENPTFENVILKLEESSKELDLLAGIFFNLNSRRNLRSDARDC